MQNGEDAGLKSPATFSKSSEKQIIVLLCIAAAIHVFIFSAAFPFFNNVDEPAHFDSVVKYSHGHLPNGMEMISSESAIYLAFFSSCAYYGTPDKFPGHKMPSPPWTEPQEKMQQDAAANSTGWQKLQNYETPQAPLYYVVAGLWWNLGKGLGLHDGRLLYWLRFLDIALVIAAIWLGYAAAKIIFPENLFIRLGVPTVIAFIPQTAFYSIGNDALSPVSFGITFILVVKWLRSDNPSLLQGVAMGLAFAVTWLTKATNLPLLAIAGLAVLIKTRQLLLDGKRRTLEAFLAFIGCAALPALAWMARCKRNFGDYTGSKAMTDFFGWTIKPFPDWWHHPIFSPYGVWTYLSGQVGTFWQGEFYWLNHPLFLPGSNLIYTGLSIILPAMVLFAVYPRTSNTTGSQERAALALSLTCFVAAVGFFALVSIIYDFHDAPNPTREHPFVREGRLMLGALIPFTVTFVYGLDRLLKRLGTNAKFFILAGMILIMVTTEVATDWPVFSNPFNWFHLP